MGEDWGVAGGKDQLTIGGIYEVILQEYHKDAEEVQDRWRFSYMELMLKKRNQRIRRENGEEEEDRIESMDELREAALQRELEMRAKMKK